MTDESAKGKERQQIKGGPDPRHFEQIDPHRRDQHEAEPNRADRDDLNLEGARRHGDPIPRNPDTVDPQLTPQPPDPPVSSSGNSTDVSVDRPAGNDSSESGASRKSKQG